MRDSRAWFATMAAAVAVGCSGATSNGLLSGDGGRDGSVRADAGGSGSGSGSGGKKDAGRGTGTGSSSGTGSGTGTSGTGSGTGTGTGSGGSSDSGVNDGGGGSGSGTGNGDAGGADSATDTGSTGDAASGDATSTDAAACPTITGNFTGNIMTSGQGCGDLSPSGRECIILAQEACAFQLVSSSPSGLAPSAVNGVVNLASDGSFSGAALTFGTISRTGCTGQWSQGNQTLTLDCGGTGSSQSCTVTMVRTNMACP